MIVVRTGDFEVYHGVVTELRDRGVTFTTLDAAADEPLPADARVLIVGPDDETAVEDPVEFVRADPENPRTAVEHALRLLRGGGERTAVGIDPGDRPGIAVLSGDTVVAAFAVPLADAADVVAEELAEAGDADPVVRVGDGARLQGAQIVDGLPEGVRVELVDETGTTPYLGQGARGMGDVLAAVNIARIEGEPVDDLDVEPTTGEIRVVKTRSREVSPENRELPDDLARRVALGELSVEDALAEHRGETGDVEGDGNGGGGSGAGDG
jgi:hypothetical protein